MMVSNLWFRILAFGLDFDVGVWYGCGVSLLALLLNVVCFVVVILAGWVGCSWL